MGNSNSDLNDVIQRDILGRDVMTPFGICRAIAWETPGIRRPIKIVVLTKTGIECKVDINQVQTITYTE